MMGNGTIALGDNLALLPWHLWVDLDVKDTSVIKHPRHRKESWGDVINNILLLAEHVEETHGDRSTTPVVAIYLTLIDPLRRRR